MQVRYVVSRKITYFCLDPDRVRDLYQKNVRIRIWLALGKYETRPSQQWWVPNQPRCVCSWGGSSKCKAYCVAWSWHERSSTSYTLKVSVRSAGDNDTSYEESSVGLLTWSWYHFTNQNIELNDCTKNTQKRTCLSSTTLYSLDWRIQNDGNQQLS